MTVFKLGRPKKCSSEDLSQSPLPTSPGVYRHRSKDSGEVEYVGQTNNIARRTYQHAYDGRFDSKKHSIEWMEASPVSNRDDWCNKE